MPYQELFKSTTILVCTTKPSQGEKNTRSKPGNSRRILRTWTVRSMSSTGGKRLCVLTNDSEKS